MRILLLTETLTAGGAEAFVVRLANRLSRDHRVTIAVMHGHLVHPAVAAKIAPAVRVDRLQIPARRFLTKFDSALRKTGVDASIVRPIQRKWLNRIVARDRPDVIHSHLLKADRLASETAASANRQLKHVVTLHGDYGPFLEGQTDPQLLNLEIRMDQVVARADAVVAISSEQVGFITSRYPAAQDKLHLIHNGFEPPAEEAQDRSDLNLPEDRFLFGMVSRGVADKGWAEAIDSFRSLEAHNAALVLVGEGSFIDKLKIRDLPKGLILAGFSANPIELIRRFDACLLPTRFPYESLPTVIMEYLYCGKPVIASDIGEIAAMLRAPSGAMAGQLLDFRDGRVSVEQFAAAMRRIMEDADLRASQSAAAHQAFERFDMEHCVQAYEALYRSLSTSSTSASH